MTNHHGIASQQVCNLFFGDSIKYQKFLDRNFSERVQAALTHIPFYQDYMAMTELAPDVFQSLDSLKLLPLIDRSLIANHEVTRFINSSIKQNELPCASYTSGTSGKPLKLYASRDFFVSIFHILRLSYGGSLPVTAAYLSDSDREMPINENCIVYFISRNRSAEEIYQRIRQISPQILFLRPDRWRLMIEMYGQRLSSLGLIVAGVTGMVSTPDEREYFQSFLCCPVLNIYGATELGACIIECPKRRFHVLSHQNYLEILNDRDLEAKPGEIGSFVWTSLDNSVMPFIRYKIGDTGAFSSVQTCECGWNGQIVDTIGARVKDSIIMPNGLRLNTYLFQVALHQGQGSSLFKEYQLIQESKGLLRLLVVKSGAFNEVLMEETLKRVHQVLHGEIQMEVTYVNRIEQTGNKFQFFVPLSK